MLPSGRRDATRCLGFLGTPMFIILARVLPLNPASPLSMLSLHDLCFIILARVLPLNLGLADCVDSVAHDMGAWVGGIDIITSRCPHVCDS